MADHRATSPETIAEIRRVIGNRDEAHPLRRGSAGWEGIAAVAPLVERLSVEEVSELVLPMLDDLLGRIEKSHCLSCLAKGLLFAERFASRAVPEKASDYRKRFEELVRCESQRRPRMSRDYEAEVREAVVRYGAGSLGHREDVVSDSVDVSERLGC